MTDLERAYLALSSKTATYTALWGYYNGDQPVVYTNERLAEVFRGLDARFTENWCAVIIDSLLERVQLNRLSVVDTGAQTVLDDIWQANVLNIEADDLHLGAFVCGEAFLIAWPDAEGKPAVYYNDPRLCHVQYDAENPRQALWAAKWWDDEDGGRRLTLYYPDRLEYYRSPRRDTERASAFQPWDEPTAPNPWGQIPVFHVRTRRVPYSEIQNALPLQNGVNKLLIDMMVAAEYGAMNQRWVISQAGVTGKLKNAPNEIWDLPAGDGVGQATQVGQFQSTDLNVFMNSIDKLAAAMAIITRTPRHYFWSQGGDPSGEALIAMEAPLNKKAKSRIERFTPIWRQVGAFLLKLAGYSVVEEDIEPVFDSVETVQPMMRAQIRNLDVTAGIPLVTSLRREGWTESELEQLAEDQAEQGAQQAAIGDKLLEAFDRGQEAVTRRVPVAAEPETPTEEPVGA